MTEHLSVWDVVLPPHTEEFRGVELIQLPSMALIDSPRSIAIERCGGDYGLQLGLWGGASASVPNIVVESSKGSNGFGRSGVTSLPMTTV